MTAHLLSSQDGIEWQPQGDLVIETTKEEKIAPSYGTPALWIENAIWYLSYDGNGRNIWLTKLEDKTHRENAMDERY